MATLTITTTAAQDARFATAVGQDKNLGRDATPAECKQFIIQFLRDVVQMRERLAAQNAIASTPFDPNMTLDSEDQRKAEEQKVQITLQVLAFQRNQLADECAQARVEIVLLRQRVAELEKEQADAAIRTPEQQREMVEQTQTKE